MRDGEKYHPPILLEAYVCNGQNTTKTDKSKRRKRSDDLDGVSSEAMHHLTAKLLLTGRGKISSKLLPVFFPLWL